MIFHEIYKIYSKNSLKNNKLLKLSCIISIVFATAILLFTRVLTDTYSSEVKRNMAITNGGDIKIQNIEYNKYYFTSEQIDKLEELKDKKHIDFQLGSSMNTNILSNGMIESTELTVVNNIKMQNTYLKLRNENDIVLSQKTANKLNVNIGDKVFLKLHSSVYDDTYFKVTDIIPKRFSLSTAQKEAEVGQEVVGESYVYLPNETKYNVAYINIIDKENTKNIKNEIKDVFKSHFEVRTIDELEQSIMNRISMQLDSINLIGAISLLITGICLCSTFIVFILNRINDFSTFKALGIKKRSLSLLVFTELMSLTIKGIIIGIIFGLPMTIFYINLQHINLLDISILSIAKNILISIVIIIIETSIFSLIPISFVKNIPYEGINRDDSMLFTYKFSFIPDIILVIFLTSIFFTIYVKSFLGIFFILVLVLLDLLVYSLIYASLKIVCIIKKFIKGKYSITFIYLDNDCKTNAFSSSLLTITIIFVLLLFMISEITFAMFSNYEVDNSIKNSIVYQTTLEGKLITDKKLIENDIDYFQYYPIKIDSIESVNNTSINDYIDKIPYENRKDVMNDLNDLSVDLFDTKETTLKSDLEYGNWFKENGNENSIIINNYLHRYLIDYKLGDTVRLKINGKDIDFKVIGFLSPKSLNKGVDLGYININETISPKTLDLPKNQPVIYFFREKLDNNLLSKLLYVDKDANLEDYNDFAYSMKTYVDDQKSLLLNIIFAVSLSSILLILTSQIIIFIKRILDYQVMYRVGMSKQKLIKIGLLERIIISVIQSILISVFYESFRFLLISLLQREYNINYLLILIEFLVVLSINCFIFIVTQKHIKLDS
ncbi:ABC transporter permease [Clostridioides sp. ES-S-0108-01]|uniref:ABC transporter permease n=1 Tax=Clostridioides sp. ES-S-0108-01 TaxID=2770773 RepID=UPI001D0C39AB|nr:ABC transporter permease [Clostridioides sp. ES-S-0108-01]UDN50715.1 ABC transporter permease [Clostridioides sp. ES-S-0107-01]